MNASDRYVMRVQFDRSFVMREFEVQFLSLGVDRQFPDAYRSAKMHYGVKEVHYE